VTKYFNLAILQLIVLFPFRFTNEFGERDGYRMFLGLMDTLRSGALFNSSLLYNREASFGYYGLLYALTPFIGHSSLTLMSAMNWIGLMSVVLFIIPSYIVTEKMFGSQVAIASSLILIATPVWWHCGLYGHPITTSLLLFFTALALLCRYPSLPTIKIRIAAVALFGSALMFRVDVALLFIALFAMLWQVRKSSFRAVAKEASLYCVASGLLFLLAKSFLPPISHGNAPPSIVSLLLRFEHISNLVSNTREWVISLGQGFTPILLLACPIAMWILLRNKQYPLLIFVSGEIIVNLLFWFPNTVPPRHFIMMAPAVSISAAIVILNLSKLRSFNGALAGAAVAIPVVAISLALNYGRSYLSYFPSQFTDQHLMTAKITEATNIANRLVGLPHLSTPIVVLCDSNLVLAEMEKRAAVTSAIYKTVPAGSLVIGVHDVQEGSNHFVMVEQSWDDLDIQGFDRSGAYPGLPVLSAPYLTISYQGARPRLSDP